MAERGFDSDCSNVLTETKDKKREENVNWRSLGAFPSQLSATVAKLEASGLIHPEHLFGKHAAGAHVQIQRMT